MPETSTKTAAKFVDLFALQGVLEHPEPWAPAGIFPEGGGGKTAWTVTKDLFFGGPKARTNIFAIFRSCGLNLKCSMRAQKA